MSSLSTSLVPVLLDCDPGLDDAIAILTAAQLTNLVGITTVNGNVGLHHTTHNALAIAQIADLDVPVHQGAARPLVNEPIDAAYVHGPSGLGSVEIPDLTRAVDSEDAVTYILDTARSVDDLHLVAIGPLTNIAQALERDPSLRDYLGGFTIMGGASLGGNTTATSEFNIWADPEAADIVFRLAGPITMVGLDITHQVLLGPVERDRLRAGATPAATLAADLLDYAVARAGELSGTAGAPIHDACAVLAVARPELFRGVMRHVNIELTGTHTRGMTVVDNRHNPATHAGGNADADPNVHFLAEVEVDVVVEEIVSAVLALGRA